MSPFYIIYNKNKALINMAIQEASRISAEKMGKDAVKIYSLKK